MAQRTIDLSSKMLGLEKVLEDDILDIMEDFVKQSADDVINGKIRSIESIRGSNHTELEKYIQEIVYKCIEDMFGGSYRFKEFRNMLYFDMEKSGFHRFCPTCIINTKRLGKASHNDNGYIS